MRSAHPTIRDHETHQQSSLNTHSARIPIGHTLSTLTQATDSRVRPPLLIVEQEEPSLPRLQAMIQDLRREADRGELQHASKLLKALLR